MSLVSPYRNRLPMAYLPSEWALLDNPAGGDDVYMDAVRRGDIVTAQRLVDAAAKAAGFDLKVYHGGTVKNIFDVLRGEQSTKHMTSALGAFFSETAAIANQYGKTKPYFISDSNLIELSFKEASEIDTVEKARKYREYAISLGYDGFLLDAGKNLDPKNGMLMDREFVILNPSQIKSADPVTYDDAGQVIPLSQRFNSESPDIRNPRTTPKQFPYRYAAYLKKNFPDIWKAGGNIRGNDTFRWWTAYRKGDRSPKVLYWWKTTRPAWIARHFNDHRLPGVIAQIKWGTVGKLGVAGMKRVVEDAIRKRL